MEIKVKLFTEGDIEILEREVNQFLSRISPIAKGVIVHPVVVTMGAHRLHYTVTIIHEL